MKHTLTIFYTFLLLAATSCQHEEIWDKLNDHETRIEQLEQLCRELNSNVVAMQTVLTAIQENDYVTEVMKVMEDGVEVGYSITFSKGGTVTIYHKTDGTDSLAPKIGVRKASDGAYYWTSGDDWLTSDDGKKIPATIADPDGEYVTPQFRVVDGVWYVSYDNGNSWREIESLNDDGEEFFQSVTTDSENLYLTLADGTIIKIPIVSTSLSFAGKVVSIMGDSISTFEGWIPIEDGHNLNHRKRYPQSNLFEDVRLTWWHMLINNLGAKLGVNDSWAGSMVSNTQTVNSGDKGPDACMSSVTRITNLGSNGTPDLIFFYGGTNDAARNVPMGTFDPSKFQQIDLTTATWSTFADAYAVAIMRMQHYYPDAKIIAMTPTWTTSYYTPQRLDEVVKMIKEVCDYFGVAVVDLRKCGINQNNLDKTLGDGIHPSALGMEMIEKYLRKQLLSFYEGDFTENVVYKVTNNLTSAVNLDRYITGVSAGRSYTAQLSGDLSKVGVQMGGNDVTSTSFNVSTGIIYIPEVTGDINIDESVEHDVVETTWYIDHTKNKAKLTSSCNTGGRGWAIADSNPAYSQLIGKPINTAAFFTNKTSQTVTVMKVPSYQANAGEVIATVTATIPSASKQLAVIYFPEVTLKEGEYLSLFSQEDSNIQFYYTSAAVKDASGVLDEGFYTRLPILYGSGANWSLADNSCLGWSFGYTADMDNSFPLDQTCIHISFDDVVACITNLSTNTYSSVYDEQFFSWLKELHMTYGTKFSLYIYDLTRLASVPATYKQEFHEAKEWLKFGLHARSSGYNYASGTYEAAQSDWNTFVEHIVRITGSYESVDRIPRLHNFAGNLESVTGMKDGKCGALGFLGADDNRVSYHLTEEQNKILIDESSFRDSVNNLIIFRTNYRGERLGSAEGMYEKMEKFMDDITYSNCFNPFIWFTHEPYVYKNSVLTEYAQNVEDVCRFAHDYDIAFVYPQNRVDIIEGRLQNPDK